MLLLREDPVCMAVEVGSKKTGSFVVAEKFRGREGNLTAVARLEKCPRQCHSIFFDKFHWKVRKFGFAKPFVV